MDRNLKDRLRRRRLMPLDIDIVMKEFYENSGKDASEFEDYTSQTSKQEADLIKRIRENVFQLCALERKNFQGERYYGILEYQIRKDLFELDMIDAYRHIDESIGKRLGRWTATHELCNCFYFTNVEHTLGTHTVGVINYSKKIFLDK